jgi:hypothetical protein
MAEKVYERGSLVRRFQSAGFDVGHASTRGLTSELESFKLAH